MSEPARRDEQDEHPGLPRWLRVSLIVAAAIVLALVVLALTGVGGSHGPDLH